jgi:hypothetical protein
VLPEKFQMRAHASILALLGLGLVSSAAAQADPPGPPNPSLAVVEASAAPAPDPDPVRLVIEQPLGGSLVESTMHMAEIRGAATCAGSQPSSFDVMIAIDVSQSTKAASGADVDGDGEIGENPHEGLYLPGEYPEDVWSTDSEDTILAAEVSAARALLESVDSERVRVGLLTFSGQVNLETGRQISRNQRDANLEVPLTRDYDRVQRALDEVGARPPRGATNFAAGIRLATQELAGLSGAVSSPQPGAKKVILFLTDGFPTFPVGQATVSDAGDLEAAVNAARVAQTAGIRINTYALGTQALTRPIAATEIARVTLGTFTPVLEPGAIVATLQSVSFANIEDVGILNLTTREHAPDVRLNPDGSFLAFVPVKEGRNRVLVNALASDGGEANLELEFGFRVKESEGRMKERELARLRKLNDELLRHMEAERIRREKRRQRMEREIEIRAVRPYPE